MNEPRPVRAWTGQFNIVDGDVREEGANVATSEGRTSEGGTPVLYVVAEPGQPEGEAMVGQMVQAIGQLFSRQDVSLTGNVLRALRGAHDSLYQWNQQQGDRAAWSSAGCSAAVLRGNDIYVAQCGPSLAYVRGSDGFQVVTPDAAARPPIGMADELRPSLTHHTLEEGGALLLSRSTLASLAADDQIESLLALPPEDALPELYLIAKAQEHFSLLLIAGLPVPEVAAGGEGRAAGGPPSRRNPFGR